MTVSTDFQAGSWIDGYQAVSPAPVEFIKGERSRHIDGHYVKGAWSDPWWMYDPERGWAVSRRWKNKEQQVLQWADGRHQVAAFPAREEREVTPWAPEPASGQNENGAGNMDIIRTAIAVDRALERGQQKPQAAANGSGSNDSGGGAGQDQPESPDPRQLLVPGARRKMPLDEARKFAGEIWWTPSDVHLDVYGAALAASHTIASFNTVPRILIRSRDMRTGKTTASDLAMLLGRNPWKATTSTAPGLKAKFNEAEPPLIICEEIQKRFGANGLTGSKDPLATFLLDGYRRTAVTPLSVDRTTMDIPAYCMAVLNGRGRTVSDDIEDRCIVIPAHRKPAGVVMPRNSLDQDTEAEAGLLRDALHAYVKQLEPVIAQLQRRWRPPHPLFTDRLDQIWRPVWLVARASDVYERELWEKACAAAAETGLPEPDEPACDWAERVMSGFRLLALDNSDTPPLESEQAMLRDAARWFRSGGGWKDDRGRQFGYGADLKEWLVKESGEGLWKQLTDGRVDRLMADAFGETAVLTRNLPDEPKRRARGWAAAPILAGWDALEASWLPALPDAPEEGSIFDDLPPEDDEADEADEGADHSNHGTDSDSATS